MIFLSIFSFSLLYIYLASSEASLGADFRSDSSSIFAIASLFARADSGAIELYFPASPCSFLLLFSLRSSCLVTVSSIW